MTARSRPSPNSIPSNTGRLIEPAFPFFRCRLRAAGGKVQICTLPAAPWPPLLFAGRRKRSRKLRETNPERKADV